VEDYLGKINYLTLLITATIVGSFLHIMIDPSSTTPCIGASGGISALIAFYAIQFSHKNIGVLYFIFPRPLWLKVPVMYALLVWIALQGFGLYNQLEGTSSVSAGAHLGGALVGLLAWLIWHSRVLKIER